MGWQRIWYFGDLAYQIKEGKGFIKEYHNDEGKKIIFKGDYLNGERNGKGKEYSIINSCLIFEGEYLNGKKLEREKNIIIKINWWHSKENI